MGSTADNDCCEIGQDVVPLAITPFQPLSASGLWQAHLGAAVAKADHCTPVAERPFGAVVGRLNALLFQKCE
jgi:hypothetical protein